MSRRHYRAPGRVNLIGEHTDYNDGLVMPAALDLSCVVSAEARADGAVVCRSANADGELHLAANAVPVRTGTWVDYVAGVALELRKDGIAPGAMLDVRSDVPLGAGLSSSAALEVAVATSLLALAGVSMEPTAVAQLCQRAENDFVGAACGIMDQYVACHARAGTALLLDCRTLTHRHLALPPEIRLVVCDSGVRHSHAAGEYNRRRAECREAAERLGVQSLRDVDPESLPHAGRQLDPGLFRRVRHVVSENQRVEALALALERGDLAPVKPILAASHASLRTDYEVSCFELDVLVELAVDRPGVFGTRMTGGGFGGSTISLVEANAVEGFRDFMQAEYARRTGRQAHIYASSAAAGAHEVGAHT